MIFGLIPAAGKSTRMGRPKLLLPLGSRTVLEHTVEALKVAGIDHVLVVVGPHVADLANVAEKGGAHALVLDAETREMRSTIERGLDWIESRFRPTAEDLVVLTPGDQPLIPPEVLGSLFAALTNNPDRTIAIPTFEGKRGHPLVLRWTHAAAIRALPAGVGVNTYMREQTKALLEVLVASADILSDLDTPEDYEALIRRWEGNSRR
jgi:molybdenum cofactor cytidylyltransferase